MTGVFRPGTYSDTQLEAEGFKHYNRKKEPVMARELPADEAPMKIKTRWGETLIAQAGYMICYNPEGDYLSDPKEYNHWPVEKSIFNKTYKGWDESFEPTKAQQQLMDAGCEPYYKYVGIWAKSLETGVYIQGLEHKRPILVPEDRVLAVGAEGEPYHMGDDTFHDRYDGTLTHKPNNPTVLKRLVNRLVNFFKND